MATIIDRSSRSNSAGNSSVQDAQELHGPFKPNTPKEYYKSKNCIKPVAFVPKQIMGPKSYVTPKAKESAVILTHPSSPPKRASIDHAKRSKS